MLLALRIVDLWRKMKTMLRKKKISCMHTLLEMDSKGSMLLLMDGWNLFLRVYFTVLVLNMARLTICSYNKWFFKGSLLG